VGDAIAGSLLSELSPSQYSRLSALLDESIEMAAEHRTAWLAALDGDDATLAAILRKLFALQAGDEARRFLETRDLLARQVGSLINVELGLVGKQFGAYRVLKLLGHGGMGSVWLAERVDGLFTRQVALKLVHPALFGRVVAERFGREREILGSLDHPHIARLIDAGFAADGQPYLALEYIAGTPFSTYCDDRRLPIRERLKLFEQILSAVQYAHSHLVIHRDLKPANILVTGDGLVHLLDFGIAKLLTEGEAKETELTQLGGRALTPDYAAPEQITGDPITTAADVYALGVMLYELLTGALPFQLRRTSRVALEEAILLAEPTLPSRASTGEAAAAARATTARKLAHYLQGDLDTITMKALKKSPLERYATANALSEDLGRFLSGNVVLAQPDSVAYRALKYARRHLVGIAVAATLILTLLGGLAATTYEAEIASRQRDVARAAQLRSLTQTAAGLLKDSDTSGAMGIILEVLTLGDTKHSYDLEALGVFQDARAADSEMLVFSGHSDLLRSATFSPDGLHIVTASADKTARIWDVASGRELIRLIGHTGLVYAARYSPDGSRIVTASADKTARIWDPVTGRQLLSLDGHTETVRSAWFSPDGRRVVTAGTDKTARIWDTVTGRQLAVMSGHAQPLRFAAYAPDGLRIVTACMDGTARIWNAATSKEIVVLRGHTTSINWAAYSPDGRRVVTASDDRTARIWDASTGQQIALLTGHLQPVLSAEFSPDGQHIVTSSTDRSARIWEAATGRQIAQLSDHALVHGAAFSPDGRRIVVASGDNTARLWDAATDRSILSLKGHTQLLAGAVFSPDGRQVATASMDKTARIWDASTGQQLTLLSGHTQLVLSAAFSPDGDRIVTASDDTTARLWDKQSGRELNRLTGHTRQVEGAVFSPDGRKIFTVSFDKSARVWDAATGAQILKLDGPAGVNWVSIDGDGKRIVTASSDKTARIWDAATGRQITVLNGHTQEVSTAAFSPDGSRVVTASVDKSVRIWETATGRQLMVLNGHPGAVTSAEYSPDGERIVTSSTDTTARIWDAATGQQLLTLRHPEQVYTATFSPDGTRILTAADDKVARIFDARTAALDVQIEWAAAAQFESLPKAERFRLGLPDPADVRRFAAAPAKCDESAAAPYDPDRRASGFMLEQIAADVAIAACAEKANRSADATRWRYQHGRALMASNQFADAARDFEAAIARQYRAARLDLAMLLAQPAANMLDVPRAVSLLEEAWRSGVPTAAFELGTLYEHGISRVGGNDLALSPNNRLAWVWYQRAADAGEPNALARFAEKDDEAAFLESDDAKKSAHRLASFRHYAAATERARIGDWPDEASRSWRYHRASLARLLERDGMMSQIADVYRSVRQR
jgi:WD40 repeat protein/serine/threonine protein kinase